MPRHEDPLSKYPPNHPQFYAHIFTWAAREERAHLSPLDACVQIPYESLSRRNERSQLQESCSIRNVLRSRRLASLLINEEGEWVLDSLPTLIRGLQASLYSLGPERQFDAKRQEHILKVFNLLAERKDLLRLIKLNERPLSNQIAEEAIRHTLAIPPQQPLTHAHARRAVLAAWLCTLRQNVGSCFATAPAEIIHDEQPEHFLQDMVELLATGRLKRTFGGIEYAVPMSATWGNGDLKKPILIRTEQGECIPEVWHSPGLTAAFEAAGQLDRGSKNQEKIRLLKNWIEPILKRRIGRSSIAVTTPEELIRLVLLSLTGVTEQALYDYLHRPRQMIQSQLLFHASHPKQPEKQGKNIGAKCAEFLYLFETAKNAFKALADNALLKSWEFTLASFSETKYELTRWNFYASLGLGADELGGIGRCMYETIQSKIDENNRQLQEMQFQYEAAFAQLKTVESRIRHASSEKEMEWLRIEYRNRSNEFYSIEEQRNLIQERSQALVDLYDILYKTYTELFKDYFQEVYDADIQEVTTGPFDDSPAGFRLLYKHGRNNTSQWTRIQDQHDYIDALSSFFAATEPQVAAILQKEDLEKELSDLITALIHQVKTKEFLESALQRMATAHHTSLVQNPLEHLDQVEKKPWVYTSGGTMNSLISCYYKIEGEPKKEEKWVESPLELLVFFADSLKQIPPKWMEPFFAGRCASMLMHSPTHAFLLKPMVSPFKEAWTGEGFTYTSLRDLFVKPAENFVDGLLLTQEMMHFLHELLSKKIPENFRPRFQELGTHLTGTLSPVFFRDLILDWIYHDKGLRQEGPYILSPEEIDSLLYSHLPFFPIQELPGCLSSLFHALPGITPEMSLDMLSMLDKTQRPYDWQVVSAKQLKELCKALICLQKRRSATSLDYPLLISKAAQHLGFAMPAPVIFGDTNWMKDEFGFVVNPGTGQFELWRFDYTGSEGYPMSNWAEWLNGSRPDRKWGIYIRPYEYGQV